MSAPEFAAHGTRQQPQQLLVVIDPLARRSDGESVRIAKDVLCAGAPAKICLPETPEEFDRALVRRGHRRPVVVGDDAALLRTVALLQRERELTAEPLSLVPVGTAGELALACALGVPAGTVAAARAVLDGVARPMDLLVDDSDGVVLGDLRVPAPGRGTGRAPVRTDAGSRRTGVRPGGAVWDACRSVVRGLVHPAAVASGPPVTHRLRVEADGVLLSDLDRPVAGVAVSAPGDGRAEVAVRLPDGGEPVRATACTVTISGPDFRYYADGRVAGPVRTRTWTLHPAAWSLTLPARPGGDAAAW
ncbi:hypothetical protein [Streptomyces sp. NRRL F-5126]|uniref:hypothetical protein n=1 Tax=Streptomyces sp. NRRL F-5126 TaxID=1463857 RepID=UPI00068FAA76|nr:hypothetical protein [Streptomyces sp. NRRL F-5126]